MRPRQRQLRRWSNASTATLRVTASGTAVALGRTIIVDYANGLYMLGAGSTPGIVIDLTVAGASSPDTLQVRGSTGVDNFALGAGAASASALNVNAGSGTGLDSVADLTFKSVETVIIATERPSSK